MFLVFISMQDEDCSNYTCYNGYQPYYNNITKTCTCDCDYHYTYNCQYCRNSLYDPTQGCQQCQNSNYDPEKQCKECIAGISYDYQYNCTICISDRFDTNDCSKCSFKHGKYQEDDCTTSSCLCTTCDQDYVIMMQECYQNKTLQSWCISGFTIASILLICFILSIFVIRTIKQRKRQQEQQ